MDEIEVRSLKFVIRSEAFMETKVDKISGY
jgi:hypothetical protein